MLRTTLPCIYVLPYTWVSWLDQCMIHGVWHTWLCRMKMRMSMSLVFFSHSWKQKRFIVLISTVISHHLLQRDVCVFSLNATCVWLSIIVHECLVGGYNSSSNELTYCGHRWVCLLFKV